MSQRLRFMGGPLDGAEMVIPDEVERPEEVVFRRPTHQLGEASDVCYSARFFVPPLDLAWFDSPEWQYRPIGQSELANVVQHQAQRLYVAGNKIEQLERRLKKL